MTPKRFRALVGNLFAGKRESDEGLSAFARWLPIDPRQARRYASGETAIPAALARLLELLDHEGIRPGRTPDQNGKVPK
jgi:hypothetical protein